MKMEKVCELPVAIIDNIYNTEEYQKISEELEYLTNAGVFDVMDTGGAWEIIDGEKVALKKNRGVFLDMVYHNRNFSETLKTNRKLFAKDFVEKLIDNHKIFRYISHSIKDTTLIQYYENSDYYDFHYDKATLTAITWFYKKPKAFTGGELGFENGLKIDCCDNRMVIFPSILEHSVQEIKLEQNSLSKNHGRYSITQFIHMN